MMEESSIPWWKILRVQGQVPGLIHNRNPVHVQKKPTNESNRNYLITYK